MSEKNDELIRDYETVRCPFCKVKPGEKCETISGKIKGNGSCHVARYDLYWYQGGKQ